QAFETTMDALRDSYFEADPAGAITFANKAFANSLGFDDPKDVIGKHFRYFTDRRVVRDIFNKFSQLYETKQPLEQFEY
ncbi:PAS domain-containing protein, partial [candidate division KSB1 bacterium]|nr:PAS domain-containing protein [candidate division KSB1 bacterium]